MSFKNFAFSFRKILLFVSLVLLSRGPLEAQTSASVSPGGAGGAGVSTEFDTSGFPQWGKDLRRGEIVAFGAFPFAYFFSNFGVDIYRSARHGWDNRYAPWPFKGQDSISKDKDDRILTIGVAAVTSIAIALVDYSIERYKRRRAAEELENLPEGTPIIIRKPLTEESAETPGGGEASPPAAAETP